MTSTLTAEPCGPLWLLDGKGGEPTLDDVVAGVWEGLTVHAVVECPVCAGAMEPTYGVHALPIAGACRDCGSSLT